MWVDVDQHSTEWLQMRTGMITASRVFDVVARLKRNSTNGKVGDYKAGHHNYLVEIVCEQLTGRAAERYVTEWMQRGIEDEEAARLAYEESTGAMVTNGGFAIHDDIKWFGASPDGLVDDNGLLELKNRKVENHYDILVGGEIPEEYIWQMKAQLACMPEREWVDYGSYCKEMKAKELRLFVRRHYRDKERIKQVEDEVLSFQAEIAAALLKLTEAHPILTAKPVLGDLSEVLASGVSEVGQGVK